MAEMVKQRKQKSRTPMKGKDWVKFIILIIIYFIIDKSYVIIIAICFNHFGFIFIFISCIMIDMRTN